MAFHHEPNLVLLDINLVNMDGFQIYNHLQEKDKTKNIPVIALTAYEHSKDNKKADDLGFHAYLSKPINVIEFKKIALELIKSSVNKEN